MNFLISADEMLRVEGYAFKLRLAALKISNQFPSQSTSRGNGIDIPMRLCG
jgi:hypothetical protein